MIEFFTSLFQGISLAHLNALLILGLALFGGTIGGRLFQKLKIPQVVGYIAIGILIGQTGFSLVPPETVRQFQPFSYFALGLISFMIGGELKFTTLRKYGRQFFSILFMEALGAFFFVGIIVSIIAYLLLQNPVQAVLTGLLLGSIAAATAPAATTDVLWEYRTRGPLTSTVFGIVALDDILALLLFAVSSSVATAFLGQGGGMAGELGNLAWEVGGALVIGGGSGFLLSQLLKVFRDEDKTLTFGLGAILLTLGLATTLKVDMLLSSMTMGILITNIAPRRSEEVFHLLRRVSTPIYVL
ncbi:MAG TPA: sodium:proton exchanger, partial [Spirochaetia bacterium]|nr:sodium:proton exchanger [Spirochaetia bacterium]